MTPSRILPDLQCSLLCEDVRKEANGNFILVGVINFLRVQQLPATALKICLFNRWTSGFGEFVETVKMIAPDQTTILAKSEMKFGMQDVLHNVPTMTMWSPVKFETPGVYYVEVLVDDVMKIRFPMAVLVGMPERPPGGPKKEP